eukprot:603699_1
MASPVLLNQTLMSLIDSATCIQDIKPLWNTMFGLTEMKNIMKQRLSTMNIAQKRDLHLKVSPMDETLPHHIVQYLIGFNDDLRHISLVNKTFHKCCESSQRLFLRQQQSDWQKEFNELHPDFGNNRIVNVYPSSLSHVNPLRLAMQHAQSGDTLLLHQGIYEFDQVHECVDENIKLIGWGSNVVIKVNDTIFRFYSLYTYLRNLTFDIDAVSYLHINHRRCSFYMENCVINTNFAALFINGKTVKIKNCVIKGGDSNATGFYTESQPDVLEIESCVFENCCGADRVAYDHHCIVLYNQQNPAKFRCIANHFKNNFGLPFVAPNPDK